LAFECQDVRREVERLIKAGDDGQARRGTPEVRRRLREGFQRHLARVVPREGMSPRASRIERTQFARDSPAVEGKVGCSTRTRTREVALRARNAARKKIMSGRTVWKARSGEPGSSAKTSV